MSHYINEFKGYQPLCMINDNEYLLYKKSRFLIVDLTKKEIKKSFRIDLDVYSKIKESAKIFQRLFRTRTRASLTINNEEVIFSKRNRIFHLDLEKQSIKEIFRSSSGFSTPLNLTKSLTEDYIAVFGDYGGNPNYEKVSIYGINHHLGVEKLYSFASNTIKHIHNIIPDVDLENYYVLTGDNEPEAGIYLIDKDFQKLIPIFLGDPKARIVVAFDTPEGLLCATDSVSHQNYIYLLDTKTGKIIKEIAKINGSCIYATKCATGFIFSTTVEPPEEYTMFNKFTLKRGKGILSNSIDILHVSEDHEVNLVHQLKKDFFPAQLFQFGTVMFAAGQENEIMVLGYCHATRKKDGEMLLLKYSY